MKINSVKFSRIPTNVITGFLGVGKTSAILHLLANKPNTERWAVLVNEFGEIGIDGALIQGQSSEAEGVFVKEVPGGCMCCTAGLPMQVALAQLIRKAKPDRLLIEPTGLGHPREVLETLKSDHFADIIDVQRILTLIDARHLADQRYATHPTFLQQLEIADVIIANKQDLYSDDDIQRVQRHVKELGNGEPNLEFSENGVINIGLLEGKTATVANLANNQSMLAKQHDLTKEEGAFDANTPEKAVNSADGFTSIGWHFDEQTHFDRGKLFTFLSGIDAVRAKATVITQDGSWGYNFAAGTLTEIPLEDCIESRVEIICEALADNWEAELHDCIVQ